MDDPIARDLRAYRYAVLFFIAVIVTATVTGFFLKVDRKEVKRIRYGDCYVAWDGDMICAVPSRVAR